MASAIIHICVAKQLNKYLKMDEKQLFLGTIAPDIAKQIGETKQKSHFILEENSDIPDLDSFLKKYQSEINNPFVMGYYIHLYTDKLWFDGFINKLISGPFVHLHNGQDIYLNTKEVGKLLYEDYTNLNEILIDKYNLDLSLFFNNVIYPKTSINEIPIAKLQIIVDKMGLIIKNSKYGGKEAILNCHDIDKFIDETTKTILENIKSMRDVYTLV